MRARSLLAVLTVAALIAVAAQPAAAAGARTTLHGTYQRMNKDLIDPDGRLRDVYADILVVGERAYRLHLPPRAPRLRGGTPVRVTGTLAGADMNAETVEVTGSEATIATTGTTKVLVILVYWTAPDSMTTAQAKSQVFTDDHGWYKEASYGQLGLSGTATGWHKITAPTGGLCYTNHMEIMTRAKAAAKAAGLDSALYNRTMVYFPQCTGSDSAGAAGWAYQPGTEVWLNGYFDRRVSVHEQGHNYGLDHAHTYNCVSDGTRVTLGGSCSKVEYGDDFDAMGASMHAAHYSATMKDQMGWLAGRKRVLTSSDTTFTLAPFETVSTTAVAAVASTSVSTRWYWIEYRRAIGYDASLPAGATDGVLIHMRDTAITPGPFLLDMSPQNGWSAAVIPPGGSWTSPESVRISVGAATASGISVTVTGNAAPPVPPGAPQNVAATGGDESARVSWSPPASNGGATIQSYEVTTVGGATITVDGSTTSATVTGLTNGTQYTFRVAARNSAGLGEYAEAVATPAVQLPSVAITAPTNGAELAGTVTLTASASPNTTSNAAIQWVEFAVDGQNVGYDDTAPYSSQWDSSEVDDGAYTLTAQAYDAAGRFATSAGVSVTTRQPRPSVAITSPTDGAVITDDMVTLTATASPAAGSSATIEWVQYEVNGEPVAFASAAPYEATWDTTAINGAQTLVARVTDSTGKSGTSAPVAVTVDHPVPSISLVEPLDGATVSGNAVAVGATAAPAPDGPEVASVEFFLDGSTSIGYVWESPFTMTWDTAGLSGEHALTAVATDTAGHRGTSAPVTVTVDNPVPSVSVTAPEDRAGFDPGTVTLSASAQPNGVSAEEITRVELAVDGMLVADVAAPGPYTAQWDGQYGYGLHSVVATAYDAAGQFARSSPVTFNVRSPAPTASFRSPGDGDVIRSGTVPVTLDVAPDAGTGAKVIEAALLVDGETVASSYVPEGATSFEFAWPATRGSHVLSATVYDESYWSGAPAAVAVTVSDPADAPTAPAAAAGGDATATVSWTAPADDGGSPISGYVVVRNDGVEYAASASPFTVTGLTNGTSYSFRVKARTAVGDGALSTATAAVTPGTRTSLSISSSASVVTYPRSVTITGVLKRRDTGAVLPDMSVQLLRCTRYTLTCSVVRTGVTSSTGVVKLSYAPPGHRDMRLRFRATGRFLSVTSSAKYVQVRAALSSAISRTSMPLGSTATVSGVLKPVHTTRYVYLQRYYSGAWRNVARKRPRSTGSVSFSVKPGARKTYTYRLRFPADADHLTGTSRTRSVKVY